MPWTTPITWSPVQLVTAANLNTHLRDNLNFLKTGLDAAGVNANGRLAADLVRNNDTTLTNASGLSFPVLASEVWAVHAVLFFNSPGTADAKFALTGPASPTAVRYGILGQVTGNAQVATAFGGAVDVATFANEEMAIMEGIVRNGANAGTVQLQFAQNSAVASNSILRAGSFLIASRIA